MFIGNNEFSFKLAFIALSAVCVIFTGIIILMLIISKKTHPEFIAMAVIYDVGVFISYKYYKGKINSNKRKR